MLQPYLGAQARTKASLAVVRDQLLLASVDDAEAAAHAGLQARQRLATEQWWAFAIGAERALSRGEPTDVLQGRALFSTFSEANAKLGQQISAERDRSQQSARNISSYGTVASVAATLTALMAAFILGRRAVRSINQPLTELRDTLTRQHNGDVDARANVDQDSTELRSLAVSFNALTDQNLRLLQTQQRALRMNELTFGIARAIRATSDTPQALDVLCAELGKGLDVDRVLAITFDAEDNTLLSAQWHLPDLPPLREMSDELIPHLTRLAGEVWLSEGFRVRDDFLAPEIDSSERAEAFRRETGARAVIMAPIGLGDRVIGMIYSMTVHEPRQWTESEARTVQQVAGFAARAIVQSDDRTHQSEYVERLERLDEQKSVFLATVSHELRTPLTSISGYLELLQDGDAGEMTEQQNGMLEVIGRNTARLRSLIEDLLVLNRIESSGFRARAVGVSMREVVIHAGQELSPLAKRGKLVLDIHTDPEALIVQGDQGALHRAVVNVVSNAIKFSRPTGAVTIRCVLDQSRRRVLVSCRDRGIGIPAHDQGLMFTRFFRASNAMDQAIPGTGLGLSIVKQIVEDHGGELRLSSVEGLGTTVVMDLPLYDPLEDQQTQETLGMLLTETVF
jgi:signal transduction histidine kinase/HAMP domain-containing protein